VLRVWDAVAALYRTGVHPALQLCVRRRGVVVLNRAIGHARGNAPDDAPDAPKLSASTETPFDLFSASKAITAMVIHKLDEKRLLHLEDRVADFIPEFARHGKHRITLRHLLAHKAGIPNLPRESMDLDLLGHPEKVVEIMCDARLRSRPGRLLAYHAVSGGFVLAAADPAFAKTVEEFQAAIGTREQNRFFQRMFEVVMAKWVRDEVAAPEVESFSTFHQRVRDAREAITGDPASRRVAVFTSGGPIGACVQEVMRAPLPVAMELNWRVRNTSITEMLYSRARISLDLFNGIAHLTDTALHSFR